MKWKSGSPPYRRTGFELLWDEFGGSLGCGRTGKTGKTDAAIHPFARLLDKSAPTIQDPAAAVAPLAVSIIQICSC